MFRTTLAILVIGFVAQVQAAAVVDSVGVISYEILQIKDTPTNGRAKISLWLNGNEHKIPSNPLGLSLQAAEVLDYEVMLYATWYKVTNQWHEPSMIRYSITDYYGYTGEATAEDELGQTYPIEDLIDFLPSSIVSLMAGVFNNYRTRINGEFVEE